MKQNKYWRIFNDPLWKWAAAAYMLVELLIQLNFYLKQYPDIRLEHLFNSLLRLGLFLIMMIATWAWCFYVSRLTKKFQVILVPTGFLLFYFFAFVKNVYLLDYLSAEHASYSHYLAEVEFRAFFIDDLAYSKDDIMRYSILVAMFYGIDFFNKFKAAESQRFTLAMEKKQLEIDLMKWQLNPHFYFNTLNNLYGLAAMRSDKTEESILKLSDIMQYVIYECKEQQVDLEKEVSFLRSYVEIERLRYEDNTRIGFSVEGELSGKQIVPLLLIQFIENGFKHGLISKDKNCWLNIQLTVNEETLVLQMENSIHPERQPSTTSIGMPSAKNLLEAYYAGYYEMDESYAGQAYAVKLRVHLNGYHT